jgi:WD40 repeat protein
MRIFLSFNSKDTALAEALRASLARMEPAAEIFFSPVSVGPGFWLPKLADAIATADAFLFLIGPKGVGPWQEVEYYAAFDRNVADRRFVLVPVLAAGALAPGLPLLRSLNLIEAALVTDGPALHRLVAALKGESVANATPLWKLVNPYRGLEAMTEAHVDYFHGRTVETGDALGALAGRPGRCPILIGASGVGKSSVAQAGVLSALKSMRWPGGDGKTPWPAGLANSRTWVHLNMRPGEAPFAALTAAITRLWGLDVGDPDQAALPRRWAERLRSSDNTLADLISATQEKLRAREGEAPERVLLYLDQGEELYTRAAGAEARRFSEVLVAGLTDVRFIALASLRADYFDRLQADQALFKAYEHINVAPLDRARLDEVVTTPAHALGVNFEDDKTAARITSAAVATAADAAADGAKPGALPLLSYLLADMWDGMVQRDDATLRLSVQAIDIGGVLARRAEDFLKANPQCETALRRLLTLRLAAVPPEGEPVRREALREECSGAEWALAAMLADHPWRLVVTSERDSDGAIVAEVAHEALLRAWPRLSSWLRDERDFLIFKSEAERARRRWLTLGMPDNGLLTGLDLARAEEWLPRRSDDLSPEITAFVRRGIEAERMQREAEVTRERERLGAIASAQARTAEMQRRSRWTLIALAVAVIAGMGYASWQFRTNLARQAQLDRGQVNLIAELSASERLRGDLDSAMRLALHAVSRLKPGDHPDEPLLAPAELAAAVSQSSWALMLSGQDVDIDSVASFSPDGTRIVMVQEDGSAHFWDAKTGKDIGNLRGRDIWVRFAVFSPDGTRIVTGWKDDTARIWDAETGEQIAVLHGHEKGVLSAAFSPDGSRIVTGSFDSTTRIWNATTAKEIAVLRGQDQSWVESVAFSPDGDRIVAAWLGGTRILDAQTGKEILVLRGSGVANSVAFSPDGSRVVTASSDRTARIWDADTGQEIAVLRGHGRDVRTAAFSPDGSRVLTASWDRTARIWDADRGQEIAVLRGHLSNVSSAAYSRDGSRIVTVSYDHTVRIWDAMTRQAIIVLNGRENRVNFAAYSPDGSRVVTASRDNTARIWDTLTGKELVVLRGHESIVKSATFSPNGSRVVTASLDKTARVWDAATGK